MKIPVVLSIVIVLALSGCSASGPEKMNHSDKSGINYKDNKIPSKNQNNYTIGGSLSHEDNLPTSSYIANIHDAQRFFDRDGNIGIYGSEVKSFSGEFSSVNYKNVYLCMRGLYDGTVTQGSEGLSYYIQDGMNTPTTFANTSGGEVKVSYDDIGYLGSFSFKTDKNDKDVGSLFLTKKDCMGDVIYQMLTSQINTLKLNKDSKQIIVEKRSSTGRTPELYDVYDTNFLLWREGKQLHSFSYDYYFDVREDPYDSVLGSKGLNALESNWVVYAQITAIPIRGYTTLYLSYRLGGGTVDLPYIYRNIKKSEFY